MPKRMADSVTTQMIAFVIEGYDPAPEARGAIALALAEAFPDVRGLHLTLVLTAAAEGLDTNWSNGWVEAPQLHRLAALVAIDVLRLQARGLSDVKAGDLARLWRAGDAVFKDAPAPP